MQKNELAVPAVNISVPAKGKKIIELNFSKKMEFDYYLWNPDFSFRATINCEGLSAETPEFELSCLKRITKQTEIPKKEYANENDWNKAAEDLGIIEVDLIKAIAKHESDLVAFSPSGKPKILYERHHFYVSPQPTTYFFNLSRFISL